MKQQQKHSIHGTEGKTERTDANEASEQTTELWKAEKIDHQNNNKRHIYTKTRRCQQISIKMAEAHSSRLPPLTSSHVALHGGLGNINSSYCFQETSLQVISVTPLEEQPCSRFNESHRGATINSLARGMRWRIEFKAWGRRVPLQAVAGSLKDGMEAGFYISNLISGSRFACPSHLTKNVLFVFCLLYRKLKCNARREVKSVTKLIKDKKKLKLCVLVCTLSSWDLVST